MYHWYHGGRYKNKLRLSTPAQGHSRSNTDGLHAKTSEGTKGQTKMKTHKMANITLQSHQNALAAI